VVDNASTNQSMKYIINWAMGEQELIYQNNTQLNYLSQPVEIKPVEYVLYNIEEALSGGDKEIESRFKNPIIFINAEKNNGFSAGNNIGIKYAFEKNDFEFVWVLNNDTVIEKDTLIKFVASFSVKRKKEKIGMLGSIQYYYNNPENIQASAGGFNKYSGNFWNLQTLYFKRDDVSYIYGASMFISKELLSEIGLLNEEYFLYYEEIDMSERLKNKFTIDVDKNIKVYHKYAGTTSTLNSDFKIYYLITNKIIFYKKYYPQYLIVAILNILIDFFRSSIRDRKLDLIYIKSLKDGLLIFKSL